MPDDIFLSVLLTCPTGFTKDKLKTRLYHKERKVKADRKRKDSCSKTRSTLNSEASLLQQDGFTTSPSFRMSSSAAPMPRTSACHTFILSAPELVQFFCSPNDPSDMQWENISGNGRNLLCSGKSQLFTVSRGSLSLRVLSKLRCLFSLVWLFSLLFRRLSLPGHL